MVTKGGIMTEKKHATVKNIPSKKKAVKGDSYLCDVCGLSVIVDEECGCVDVHEILCCGKPMGEKKIKIKTTK